jgi:hypothetical protein
MVLSLWDPRRYPGEGRLAIARLDWPTQQMKPWKPDLPAPHRGYENSTGGKNQRQRGSAKTASRDAGTFTKFAFQMPLWINEWTWMPT